MRPNKTPDATMLVAGQQENGGLRLHNHRAALYSPRLDAGGSLPINVSEKPSGLKVEEDSATPGSNGLRRIDGFA